VKVSELLLREVGDPRVKGCHLTRVEMNADLSIARISWRPTPGGPGAAEVVAGLRAAAGFLRREVGRGLRLRHVPELVFRLDEMPDEEARLEALLAGLHGGGAAPSSDDEDVGEP